MHSIQNLKHIRPMKKNILAITFLILALSATTAQDTLRLLSYNIEGMKPGTDYSVRLQVIIQELKSLDPDILGLQEVAQHSASDNMAQTIADSLSLHFNTEYYVYWQFTHTAYSSYSEGIGIVSKWPVTTSGSQNLPVAVFPRKVLWNQIDIQGTPLHFFTTHLAYRDEDNFTRIQQVNTINTFISSKVSAVSGPAILTGDFNCTPGSDPVGQLYGYTSSWEHLHPTLSGHTYPAGNPYKKIDYVFIRDSSQPEILNASLEFSAPYNGVSYPSDHLGLMTTIVMQTTSIDQAGYQPDQLQLLTYPNPFNASLTMRINLQLQTDLRLEIFNLQGKQRFLEEFPGLVSGEYFFTWQPEIDDSSGVYLCRIRTKNETIIQKLILIK